MLWILGYSGEFNNTIHIEKRIIDRGYRHEKMDVIK